MLLQADVEHTSGRESKETYNESLAGVTLQDYYLESFAQQNLTIDPYFENGTLLPFIEQDALLPQGTGDDRLMAFEYLSLPLALVSLSFTHICLHSYIYMHVNNAH